MMMYRNIATVSKKELRVDLQADIENFLENGGVIKKCRMATASGVKEQLMRTADRVPGSAPRQTAFGR